MPAHIVLNASITVLDFLAMFIAYGLFTAKSWSYKPAIAVPLLTTTMHGGVTALYASAPTELGLAQDYSLYLPLTLINLAWTTILLLYPKRPKTKQYIKDSSLAPLPRDYLIAPQDITQNKHRNEPRSTT